ncbi:MAG: polysaccharide deacetylase family protein [Rhodanobacteraceae bacterium]
MNPRPRKATLLRWLPDSLVLTRGPRAGRAVYLSFDDGPDPECTPRLLDLLASHNARASFFLIGERAERYPGLVERLVAEGHLLGNHSYSHARFETLPLATQLDDIARTDRVLCAFDHRVLHRFRPPYGVLPFRLVMHCAWRRRNIAYWSYDSLDYQDRSAQELAGLLRRQPPRIGDIVLMHDNREHTIALLEMLLPEWHEQGLALEALPPMSS